MSMSPSGVLINSPTPFTLVYRYVHLPGVMSDSELRQELDEVRGKNWMR